MEDEEDHGPVLREVHSMEDPEPSTSTQRVAKSRSETVADTSTHPGKVGRLRIE